MTAEYTVTAERGERLWTLQCVEVPGAISEVEDLKRAQEYMAEAIGFVAGVDPGSVRIKLDVQGQC